MYIGVTGFMHREEVRVALSCVPDGATPYLMVGVLASYKTLQGQPAGNPNRYPRREDISSIFTVDHRTLNLVHYNTKDQSTLAAQIADVLRWGGPACDGLQLNIVWPDPAVVKALRRARPEITIVLQLNRPAMQACANDAEKTAHRVWSDYGDSFDYVLVDASGGAGIPLDPVTAAAYMLELERVREENNANFRLGVAGGLSAENLAQLLVPIRMLLQGFSIDAEGALRTDDHLDSDKVRSYVTKSFDLMGC